MRAVYRNPNELATCIKDIIDTYLEDLMSYEDMETKLVKISEANGERVYKDGFLNLKIARVLGNERVEIMNKAVAK